MVRPQLLLLPGLLNDAELWRDQVAGLSDIAECVVPDLTQGGTLAELARAVLGQAAPRFCLAGFSFGGYVAQEMARIAPERIERLALLDTSFRADTPDRAAKRRKSNDAARAPGHFHGFGEKLLETYLHPDNLHDRAIADRIRGMTERLGPAVFLRQNAIEREDGAAVLRSLRCPVMILCGDRDSLTSLSEHQAMVALVPQSRLIARSGHMTPLENPGSVTAALRSWLSSETEGSRWTSSSSGR